MVKIKFTVQVEAGPGEPIPSSEVWGDEIILADIGPGATLADLGELAARVFGVQFVETFLLATGAGVRRDDGLGLTSHRVNVMVEKKNG